MVILQEQLKLEIVTILFMCLETIKLVWVAYLLLEYELVML